MSKKAKNPPSGAISGIDVLSYHKRYIAWAQMNPDGFRKLPRTRSNKSGKLRPMRYLTDKILHRAWLIEGWIERSKK